MLCDLNYKSSEIKEIVLFIVFTPLFFLSAAPPYSTTLYQKGMKSKTSWWLIQISYFIILLCFVVFLISWQNVIWPLNCSKILTFREIDVYSLRQTTYKLNCICQSRDRRIIWFTDYNNLWNITKYDCVTPIQKKVYN